MPGAKGRGNEGPLIRLQQPPPFLGTKIWWGLSLALDGGTGTFWAYKMAAGCYLASGSAAAISPLAVGCASIRGHHQTTLRATFLPSFPRR